MHLVVRLAASVFAEPITCTLMLVGTPAVTALCLSVDADAGVVEAVVSAVEWLCDFFKLCLLYACALVRETLAIRRSHESVTNRRRYVARAREQSGLLMCVFGFRVAHMVNGSRRPLRRLLSSHCHCLMIVLVLLYARGWSGVFGASKLNESLGWAMIECSRPTTDQSPVIQLSSFQCSSSSSTGSMLPSLLSSWSYPSSSELELESELESSLDESSSLQSS